MYFQLTVNQAINSLGIQENSSQKALSRWDLFWQKININRHSFPCSLLCDKWLIGYLIKYIPSTVFIINNWIRLFNIRVILPPAPYFFSHQSHLHENRTLAPQEFSCHLLLWLFWLIILASKVMQGNGSRRYSFRLMQEKSRQGTSVNLVKVNSTKNS